VVASSPSPALAPAPRGGGTNVGALLLVAVVFLVVGMLLAVVVMRYAQ